jgi:hypothetical protein
MQKAIINAITSSKIDDEEYLRNCWGKLWKDMMNNIINIFKF